MFHANVIDGDSGLNSNGIEPALISVSPVPKPTPSNGLSVPRHAEDGLNITDGSPPSDFGRLEKRDPSSYCQGEARDCYFKQKCFICIYRPPPYRNPCSYENRVWFCVRKCGPKVKICIK